MKRAITIVVLAMLSAISIDASAQMPAWSSVVTVATSSLAGVTAARKNMADDGAGGVFIRWSGLKNGSYWVDAQHIDGRGRILMNQGTQGIRVSTSTTGEVRIVRCAGGSNGAGQRTTDDRGDSLFTWTDGDIIFVEKHAGGELVWCGLIPTSSGASNPEILCDHMGGAFVAWNSAPPSNTIYLQRIVDLDRMTFATLSTPQLDLGDIRTGTTALENVLLRNLGNQKDLSIINTQSAAGIAAVVAPDMPAIVRHQSSEQIFINVQPEHDGPFIDTVMLQTTDLLNPQQRIIVAGNAVYPKINLGETGLRFRSTILNPVTLRLAVRNIGTAPLNFSEDPVITGENASEFAVSGEYASIPPGGMQYVSVTFTPDESTGSHTAMLRLETDDHRTGPVLIPLEGFANPAVASATYAP